MNLTDKIAAFSIAEPNTGCWLWERATHGNGYGFVTVRGRSRLAHRASYEAFVGPIPEGLQIDHTCRQPSCVNPAHLEAVTAKENVRRSRNRNRGMTVCRRGHEFTEANTYLREDRPGRMCRACHALRQQNLRRGIANPRTPGRRVMEKLERPSPVERLRGKTEQQANGCWHWIGALAKATGYGVFDYEGRTLGAHRIAYQLLVGAIPDGHVVHHVCGVRRCVNPEHLQAVPQRDNLLATPTTQAAKNVAKVVCIHGHTKFAVDRAGKRFCRECGRNRQRAYRLRKGH